MSNPLIRLGVDTSIASSKARASEGSSTGVFPRFTPCERPRRPCCSRESYPSSVSRLPFSEAWRHSGDISATDHLKVGAGIQ
jgi:hypothetical protein